MPPKSRQASRQVSRQPSPAKSKQASRQPSQAKSKQASRQPSPAKPKSRQASKQPSRQASRQPSVAKGKKSRQATSEAPDVTETTALEASPVAEVGNGEETAGRKTMRSATLPPDAVGTVDAQVVPPEEDLGEPEAKKARVEDEQPSNQAGEADLMDLLGDEDDAAPVAEEEPLAPPPPAEPEVIIRSWQELFGNIDRNAIFPRTEGLEDEAPEEGIEDPELKDCLGAIRECFGPLVEDDIGLAQQVSVLRQAVAEAKMERSLEAVDECFGIECRTQLLSTKRARFTDLEIRTVPRPKNPLRKLETCTQRMLVEMPTIYPNRQTLHTETSRYAPEITRLQESTPRAVYTPQNIMRWSYIPSKKTFLSNARLVDWSDGSSTIHVGSDVYEVFDSTDMSLHMVAQRSVTKEGDEVAVEAVPVNRHVVVRAAAGVSNSVETFIQYHSNKERAIELQSRVPVPLNQLPDFDVARDKRPPRKETISEEEEFVKTLRAERAKTLSKVGGRVSLTDYIKSEIEIFKMLEEARANGELKERLQKAKDEAAKKKQAASRGHATRAADNTYEDEDEGQYEDLEDQLANILPEMDPNAAPNLDRDEEQPIATSQ